MNIQKYSRYSQRDFPEKTPRWKKGLNWLMFIGLVSVLAGFAYDHLTRDWRQSGGKYETVRFSWSIYLVKLQTSEISYTSHTGSYQRRFERVLRVCRYPDREGIIPLHERWEWWEYDSQTGEYKHQPCGGQPKPLNGGEPPWWEALFHDSPLRRGRDLEANGEILPQPP